VGLAIKDVTTEFNEVMKRYGKLLTDALEESCRIKYLEAARVLIRVPALLHVL
jgi:hypothetical protein